MDCPTCGLTNPPEALRCDCGYDFSANKPADFPGRQISLAWQQKVAAFWSISWPAWIGAMALSVSMSVFMSGLFADIRLNGVTYRPGWSEISVNLLFEIVSDLAFFVMQALLTRRLVRKNYRSFRVYVVRGDGTQSRNLSIREAVSVWVWILGPQIALLLLELLVVWFSGTKLEVRFPLGVFNVTVNIFSELSPWLRFLVVGPYAVSLALRMEYPAFRLEAHAFPCV